MPQLKSGRHVALSIIPYVDAISSGTDEEKYAAIVAILMDIPTPQALKNQLIVCYYDESKGTPPDAPIYSSGHCVADILDGRSNWASDEVEEFRSFLDSTPSFIPWLKIQFDELMQIIRNNPLAPQLFE